MASALVFLVAQVVNENPEAVLRPVRGGPAMTPTGQSGPLRHQAGPREPRSSVDDIRTFRRPLDGRRPGTDLSTPLLARPGLLNKVHFNPACGYW